MRKSILSRLVIKNVKTGKPSYTLTAFMVGILVVNIKLAISGIEFSGVKMSDFSGVDYGAAIAALGGIYSLNKHLNKKDVDSSTLSKETE
jgi:hypothetical protein